MSKIRPYFNAEFRRNAVNLLLTSGHSLKQVAGDLGISTATLRAWRNRTLHPDTTGKTAAGGAGADGGVGVVDPALEIRRLHKENEYLRRQRDILKKAMSIVSEDPQLGMR